MTPRRWRSGCMASWTGRNPLRSKLHKTAPTTAKRVKVCDTKPNRKFKRWAKFR
jgi:hypothetical protein